MMSEMAENYRRWNQSSRENKRLREQVSLLAAEKLSVAKSYAQHSTQVRESTDRFLAAQLAAEEKLSVVEEENRSLWERLAEN